MKMFLWYLWLIDESAFFRFYTIKRVKLNHLIRFLFLPAVQNYLMMFLSMEALIRMIPENQLDMSLMILLCLRWLLVLSALIRLNHSLQESTGLVDSVNNFTISCKLDQIKSSSNGVETQCRPSNSSILNCNESNCPAVYPLFCISGGNSWFEWVQKSCLRWYCSILC